MIHGFNNSWYLFQSGARVFLSFSFSFFAQCTQCVWFTTHLGVRQTHDPNTGYVDRYVIVFVTIYVKLFHVISQLICRVFRSLIRSIVWVGKWVYNCCIRGNRRHTAIVSRWRKIRGVEMRAKMRTFMNVNCGSVTKSTSKINNLIILNANIVNESSTCILPFTAWHLHIVTGWKS